MINKSFFERLKAMGPGAVVAAAVVGPGTVTACGLVGFKFSYSLSWALVFSVIAMVILQRMTAKIGLVTGNGLAESIHSTFRDSWLRVPLFGLLLGAIFIGNCAYQAGNVVGASTGISILFGNHRTLYCIIISGIALALVMSGSIKYVSKVLTGLVFLMAIVFFITAIIVKPDMGALINGMFVPSIPDGATLNSIALIGTTLVPYCLYLHASTTAEKKKANMQLDLDDALVDSMYDSILNAVLTAVISISIVIVGASLALRGETVSAVSDLAKGLEPSAGVFGKVIFSIGIFAAGISSSITAPLAATYVITGIMGWSTDLKDNRFRIIVAIVFIISCIAAILGGTPTAIITFAQAFNGVALPISICVLTFIAAKSKVLDQYVNSKVINILSIFVFIISIFMAYRTAVSILG